MNRLCQLSFRITTMFSKIRHVYSMNKAIKIRLYPTTEQKIMFAKTFGCCRKVWNLMLADKIAYYKEHHQKLHTTPAHYKKDYPYLREVDSLALANVQLHQDRAMINFFEHRAKYPKFKSKRKTRKSYTTNNQNGTVYVGDGYIHLPKVGNIKAVIHRQIPDGWKLKSATVSQDSAGNYYCSLLYEYEADIRQVPVSESMKAEGFDYKSDGLFMDSEGRCADMPKYFRQSQKKLARAQRTLSRRQGAHKGEEKSHRYLKQQLKVNKIYRKSSNQRLDTLHKISTEKANQYDIIGVETLNQKAIANKHFHNGKATMDNGYGMFLRMLEYKLHDRGKYMVRVGKWYPSSQLCHICGHRQKMPLNQRTYVCPVCGEVIDRDVNAAINIKHEAMRILMSA